MPRAAVAAVAVLGLGSVAACAGSTGHAADRPDRAILAGSGDQPSDGQADPDSAPDIDPNGDAGGDPATGNTPVGGRPWDDRVTAACDEAISAHIGALGAQAGLRQVAQARDGIGVTSFWVGGGSWAACDLPDGTDADGADPDGTEADGTDPAEPSLHTGRVRDAGFSDADLLLTRRPVDGVGDGAVRYVAAGLLPWPVQELAYTFPDDHTEPARFVRSERRPRQTWWVVGYTAHEGPLADADSGSDGDPDPGPGGDPGGGAGGADLGPLTVSITGAAAEAFRIAWDDAQCPADPAC